MEDDHQEIVGKETAYQQSLETAEKGREERHKMLNRAQAQILTNVVLQNERSSLKRTRSPKDDDNPEKRRPKKPLLEKDRKKPKETENSKTLVTTDNLAEVSNRKTRGKERKRIQEKKKQTRRSECNNPQRQKNCKWQRPG